jgi:hypothetical protein
MPPSRPIDRALGVLALAVLLVAGACSASRSDDDAVVTTTSTLASTAPSVGSTTAGEGSTSTSTERSTTSIPVATDAISVAVYWTRPAGTARPIDIPAYVDPEGGPFPYVLYGAVTNTGATTIDQPRVTVDWFADGVSLHQSTVAVLDPNGDALDQLAPGATGDLLVVVDAAPIDEQLADAQPSFGLAQP